MWNDPIVEEARREREAHAERHGFDISSIGRELRQLQDEERERGRVILSPPPPGQRKRSPAA